MIYEAVDVGTLMEQSERGVEAKTARELTVGEEGGWREKKEKERGGD